MKALWPIVLAIFLTQFDLATWAQAKTRPVSKSAQSAKSSQSQLSTKIDFEGHQVGGSRNLPFGAETAVDSQKADRDLIGVRQNFQDRIEDSESMR